MKPTLEQVQEWRAMAYRYADKQTGDYNEADEIAQEKFAELAAQWGAEQAQHEAKNAPWLTTAHMICTDAGIAHGHITERLEALRDMLAEQAQPTTAELPEAVGYMNAGHVHELTQRRISYGYVYPKKETGASVAVHTAAQMHEHFQAGVRAGMAQSQDAKRYRFIRDNIYRLPYDDHGAGPEFDLSEEAIDSAMQGGQHE